MAKRPSKRTLPAPLAEALKDLVFWLETEQVSQVIVGGVAVALIARPRVTQDIDAVIWVDTGLLDSFIKSGERFRITPRIDDIVEFARLNRVLLLQHEATGIGIDLSCGALPFESEMIDRAIELTVKSLKIRVATPEDLIVMKALPRRNRDIADIEAIIDINPNLDYERIRYWVREFAIALEMPEILTDLEKMLPH